MSAPVVLNKHFEVISYDGGALYGDTGINKVFNKANSESLHLTNEGKNFDLVVEYTGPEDVFTLSHLTFNQTLPKMVRERLRNVAVWVHSTKPDVTTYTNRFDNMFPSTYFETDAAARTSPAPDAFLTIGRTGATAEVLAKPVSGKFIHFKFIDSYVDAGIMIGIGAICIVGQSGAHAPAAEVTVAAMASSTAAPIVASTTANLSSMDWSSMFGAKAGGSKVVHTVKTVLPETSELLVSIDALPPVFNKSGINKVHSTFEKHVNAGTSVFLVSTLPVAEAKKAVAAGTATEAQKEVCNAFFAMDSAAKQEGFAPVNFFYVDETIEESSIEPSLTYLSLPAVTPIVLPEAVGTSYGIYIISENYKMVLDGQDKTYLLQGIEILSNQAKIAMTGKGLAKKAAERKQQFVQKVKSFDDGMAALTESLATLSLTPSEEVSNLSRSIYNFVQLFLYHESSTGNTELEVYNPCQATPADNLFPNYPLVKIANSKTFNELVIAHDRPVYVVYNGSDIGSRLSILAIDLARVFKKHNIDIDIVLFDPNFNSLPDFTGLIEASDYEGAIRLFYKTDKRPENMCPFQVDLNLNNANNKFVNVIDLSVIKSAQDALFKYMDGEDVNEDEDEDEEGMDGEEQISIPSVVNIYQFLRHFVPSIFPFTDDSKEAEVLKADLELSFRVLMAPAVIEKAHEVLSKHLAGNGIGCDLKYRLVDGSDESKALVSVSAGIEKITDILASVATPVGTWSKPTPQHAAPVSIETKVEEIDLLMVDFKASLQTIGLSVTNFLLGRETLVTVNNVVERFQNILPAADAAAFVGFQTQLVSYYGVLPKIACTLDSHIYQRDISKPTSEFLTVDLEAVARIAKDADALYKKVSSVLLAASIKMEKESGFDKAVICVNNMDEFERVLSGFVNPVKPPVKKVGGKIKKNDPMVENAEERVIAVFFTNNLCDYDEMRQVLVKYSKISDDLGETLGSPKPIVMVRINCKHFDGAENLYELFKLSQMPSLRVFASMEIVDDMNVNGNEVDFADTIFSSIVSSTMNDDGMDGEYENEFMYSEDGQE